MGEIKLERHANGSYRYRLRDMGKAEWFVVPLNGKPYHNVTAGIASAIHEAEKRSPLRFDYERRDGGVVVRRMK